MPPFFSLPSFFPREADHRLRCLEGRRLPIVDRAENSKESFSRTFFFSPLGREREAGPFTQQQITPLHSARGRQRWKPHVPLALLLPRRIPPSVQEEIAALDGAGGRAQFPVPPRSRQGGAAGRRALVGGGMEVKSARVLFPPPFFFFSLERDPFLVGAYRLWSSSPGDEKRERGVLAVFFPPPWGGPTVGGESQGAPFFFPRGKGWGGSQEEMRNNSFGLLLFFFFFFFLGGWGVFFFFLWDGFSFSAVERGGSFS